MPVDVFRDFVGTDSREMFVTVTALKHALLASQ